MAKAKAKNNGGVQNKSIYSRASYLFQAASYLASCAHEAAQGGAGGSDGTSRSHEPQQQQQQQQQQKRQKKQQKQRAHQLHSLSRRALADMRAVTLKAQIRQSQALKRSVCKACDTLLVEGRTCRSVVENASRGGRKPWADVLVVRCATCGTAKRFPVAPPPRQTRKALRSSRASLPMPTADGRHR